MSFEDHCEAGTNRLDGSAGWEPTTGMSSPAVVAGLGPAVVVVVPSPYCSRRSVAMAASRSTSARSNSVFGWSGSTTLSTPTWLPASTTAYQPEPASPAV